jgi:hypothetical protein
MELPKSFKFQYSGSNKFLNELGSDPKHQSFWESVIKTLQLMEVELFTMIGAEGQIPDSIYYLHDGTVIAYALEGDKKVVIQKWIGPCVVADILAYARETPSNHYIKLVQESILFKIEKAAIKSVLSEYPESANLLISLLSDKAAFPLIFTNIFSKDDNQADSNLFSRELIDIITANLDIATYLSITLLNLYALYKGEVRSHF